ncbi:MAG: hypothetical protein WBQ73_00470 [Candidatus Babeliales bacterium]
MNHFFKTIVYQLMTACFTMFFCVYITTNSAPTQEIALVTPSSLIKCIQESACSATANAYNTWEGLPLDQKTALILGLWSLNCAYCCHYLHQKKLYSSKLNIAISSNNTNNITDPVTCIPETHDKTYQQTAYDSFRWFFFLTTLVTGFPFTLIAYLWDTHTTAVETQQHVSSSHLKSGSQYGSTEIHPSPTGQNNNYTNIRTSHNGTLSRSKSFSLSSQSSKDQQDTKDNTTSNNVHSDPASANNDHQNSSPDEPSQENYTQNVISAQTPSTSSNSAADDDESTKIITNPINTAIETAANCPKSPTHVNKDTDIHKSESNNHHRNNNNDDEKSSNEPPATSKNATHQQPQNSLDVFFYSDYQNLLSSDDNDDDFVFNDDFATKDVRISTLQTRDDSDIQLSSSPVVIPTLKRSSSSMPNLVESDSTFISKHW